MSNQRTRIEKPFEFALLLLGILSAAEFQYIATVLPIESGEKFDYALMAYFLRIFTTPFMIILCIWLIKELAPWHLSKESERSKEKVSAYISELCWDLWSITLFHYFLLYLGFGFLGLHWMNALAYAAIAVMILLLVWLNLISVEEKPLDSSILKRLKLVFRWSLTRVALIAIAYIVIYIVIMPY